MVNGDVVECIVTLPGQLFYSTGIAVSLWIMRKGKNAQTSNKVLFINARNLGHMIDRKVKELSAEDISYIATTYHKWRTGDGYVDIPGFCAVATREEIAAQEYILMPGRYVGEADGREEDEPFEEKMDRLTSELNELFSKSNDLQNRIRIQLGGMGYDV